MLSGTLFSIRRAAWALAGAAGIAACLAFGSYSFAQQSFVGARGRPRVEGTRVVDEKGEPITLRGMSLYCWNQQGKQFFNKEAVGHLARDWKCTLVRIAVLPRDVKNSMAGEIERVKTVIDACAANGVYALVDYHSMQSAQNDVATPRAFFEALAKAYARSPNVMYEIWNEPVQESWEVIKGYHEAVIPAIRAVDPESIIVVGSRHWDQELEEASLNPIKGVKNVAYAIHFYSGTHRQALRDNGARAMKNGVALFASEYGLSTASGNGGLDFAEQKLWWDWLDENHISSANWSVAALDETSAAFKPGASPTGPWPDEMLKPSGIAVRDYLIGKNGGR